MFLQFAMQLHHPLIYSVFVHGLFHISMKIGKVGPIYSDLNLLVRSILISGPSDIKIILVAGDEGLQHTFTAVLYRADCYCLMKL